MTATAGLMSSSAAFLTWKNGSGRLSPEGPKAALLRAELGGLTETDLQRLRAEVDKEVRRRLDAFHRGVLAYRQHPYKRDLSEPAAVWEAGTTRLLDYGGRGRSVLFVPSLVNRAYILDLSRRSSLLRWLSERDIRPLLVDWGSPGAVEQDFDLTDYIRNRLVPALAWVEAATGGPVPVAGYCMGGLLALALAILAPEQVSRLALLATPWDFHAANTHHALALATAARFLDPMLAAGILPVDVIQALFWSIDPFLVLQKFVRFADTDPASGAALAFVALEDWLNDGIPLAAPVARECLIGWYGENAPAACRWQVDGMIVDPGRVRCPSFVAVSGSDRIVPLQSAHGLTGALPNVELLKTALGHIGMVAGRRAKDTVWQPLANWLAA